MIKFYAFILSCLSFAFLATPAHAGRLLFWRFEANQSRLVFTTDRGVQPTAQLIANPTRLVIDLPGTILGRPTVHERYRGAITGLRIGQFNSNTTRVVIQLAPGYILEPQQIKIQGVSPTQWSVNLPRPKRGNFPSSQSNNSSGNILLTSNLNTNNRKSTLVASNSLPSNSDDGLQVTSSGLILGVDGSHKNKIKVERSKDRRQINVKVEGLEVPQNLIRSWAVNQYGISDLEVNQTSSSQTTLTLNVHPDSPDWRATFMRTGGLLLWPQGGINRVASLSSPQANNSNNNNINIPVSSSNSQTTPINSQSTPIPVNQNFKNNNNRNNNNEIATLDYLVVNYNQLIIKSNQSIQAKANWINGNRVYQIRLENTKLSPSFRDPRLSSNSPIARLRISEPDNKTVILLIEPARGTNIQSLNQLRNNLWTLALNKNSSFARRSQTRSIPINPVSVSPWDITPGRNTSQPIRINTPRPAANNNRPIRKSKTLVVIDPGHGGKDPGAIGIGGIQEKRVVMNISKEVERILESQGIQVKMTRGSDYFVSLQGRTNMANRINADLFVSIHANSAGRSKPHVNGYETYYFQSGRSLAAVIHRNVLRRVNVRDRKVRKARFYVLRKSAMPAVLIETGFLTGREDVAKLSNSWFQKQMAKAIASGIIEYVKANRL